MQLRIAAKLPVLSCHLANASKKQRLRLLPNYFGVCVVSIVALHWCAENAVAADWYHLSRSRHMALSVKLPVRPITSRSKLRTGNSLRYEQPRTGTRLRSAQRAFTYAVSAAWNSLPPSLRCL